MCLKRSSATHTANIMHSVQRAIKPTDWATETDYKYKYYDVQHATRWRAPVYVSVTLSSLQLEMRHDFDCIRTE